MPRYFFHNVADRREHDLIGAVLSGEAAAKREAVRFAGAMIRDHPDLLLCEQSYRVEVQDERGGLVFAVTMNATDLAAYGDLDSGSLVTTIRASDPIRM